MESAGKVDIIKVIGGVRQANCMQVIRLQASTGGVATKSGLGQPRPGGGAIWDPYPGKEYDQV